MPEATSGLNHPTSDGLLLDDELVSELVEDLGAEEFDKLVAIYDHDLTRRIDELRDALAGADLAAARRILHAMAGSSASIGAPALAALCRSAMHDAALATRVVDEIEAGAAATRAAFGNRHHARAGAIG